MRIEQIEAFVKTAECGSFANAAIALEMRRSTISAAVSALEDELAINLFQRSGNSLQITPIAQALLADSQRLLQSASRIRQLGTQHLEGIETELRVARDDALPETFWHQCMHDLHAEFPQTSTSVYLLPTQEHHEFIDNGIVDITFGVNNTTYCRQSFTSAGKSGSGDRKRFKPIHADLSDLPAKRTAGDSEPNRPTVFRPYHV
jgi:DNA-binding transcriptional LysR family regulator